MALVKPSILQIVGYQNSGKTTMTVKLIKALTDLGLRTVTVKHHGHGGEPIAAAQKDSTRHLAAGAIAASVEGDGRFILQADGMALSLAEQIELLGYFKPDVILIEGHKTANYPKLLMVRNPEDLELLQQISNVQTVIYWNKQVVEDLTAWNIPFVAINDEELVHKCIDLLQK